MQLETIVLPSAGSLAIAAICLTLAVFQGALAWKKPDYRWNAWGALLSLSAGLYSFVVFVQFNSPAGPVSLLCERVQYSTFVLILHALCGVSFSFLNCMRRRFHWFMGLGHGVWLVLIWWTDLIVGRGFVARKFLWLSQPYLEPVEGVLGPVYLLYVLAGVIAIQAVWFKRQNRSLPGAKTLIAGFVIWAALGLHDILGTLGMPTVLFVMEYGFLGFCLSVISITVRKHMELHEIVDRSEKELLIAKSGLEQRVQARTAQLARSNQELKTEIHDRKRIEEALRKSEEKFKTLIANITDVIVILDSQGVIRYQSPNVAQHFGWDPRRLVGTDGWALIHPEDLARVTLAAQKLTASPGGTLALECRYRHKDQAYRTIEMTVVNMLDNARIEGVVVNYRDITGRIASEQALKKSEQRLKKAQAIAHVGNWELDLATRMIWGSEEWFRLYGLVRRTPAIALDQVRACIVAEDQPLARQMLNELVYQNKDYDFVFRVRRADDGKLVWLHSKAELVKREDGLPPLVSGVVQDITAAKQAEEEKIQLENQLRQAQKMESIGTLAGGIAHDFNNILSPIIGFAEITAADLPEDAPARTNMGEILKAASRAKEMVQQILTFSRRHNTELKPLKVQTVIQEALKLMRSSLPTTIEIGARLADEAGFVMGDSTQIHQMLINLCTNAYQAMRETGGRLEVRLDEVVFRNMRELPSRAMQPGAYVRVRVSDTGHGMTPEVMERIFEPYFTTKGPGEGTGMGLSMVHGIIKRHKGHIDVQSQLGVGTRFTLYLPQIVQADEASLSDTTEFVPFGTERLLLVDDEPQLLEMQRQMLKRLGYEVSACNSSAEALKAFEQAPAAFDLLITDQTMPGLTGVELALKVRRLRCDLPIILCTGYSESVSPEAAAGLGIRHYLNKPVPFKLLATTVRVALNDVLDAVDQDSRAAAGR